VGHRHAVAALFALFLALLVPLGRRLDLGTGAALAAGLVMLFTRYSAYHLVWITDGNHTLQGLAFVGAALLLVDGLARAWLKARLRGRKPGVSRPSGSQCPVQAAASSDPLNVRTRWRSSNTIGHARAGQVQAMARSRKRRKAPAAFMATRRRRGAR